MLAIGGKQGHDHREWYAYNQELAIKPTLLHMYSCQCPTAAFHSRATGSEPLLGMRTPLLGGPHPRTPKRSQRLRLGSPRRECRPLSPWSTAGEHVQAA